MESKKKFWKYLLFPAIGFAIGGVLWGWECYRGTIGAGESFTNPFSFILGAVYLGFFGSLFLSLLEKKSSTPKKVAKRVLGGVVGCIIGFLIPAIFVDAMLKGGSIITPVLGGVLIITGLDIIQLLVLSPSLVVGQLWLEFLFSGIIITLFYALIFKIKIKPLIWRGGIGFALASLISPVIGNLLSVSLFFTYLVTFLLIGFIFGLFFGWGIWRSKNVRENL